MTDSPENKKEESKKEPSPKKKRPKKKHIILGALVVLSLIMWLGLQPLTATTEYGICRTYIETEIRYPTTFKITQYDEFGRSLRLFYTYTDEYGGQRSEMIECISNINATGSYIMDDIKIDRKSIGPKKLLQFNNAIPGILKGNPNLVIPKPTKEGFADLKRD